jgi:hypothetical protein
MPEWTTERGVGFSRILDTPLLKGHTLSALPALAQFPLAIKEAHRFSTFFCP